ncbi:MAG: type I-C CRISPR-associated protein Cas5c [Acidobacteria bacterium]|nr:type I-C CRISPR-associated protein Cas5c [Acidobacteriota bacterium]MCI0718571.1 type I-C CRISPR-associated protein Cas5c [Acidobacteriota bacterium]
MKNNLITLRIWGDFACFTRPEMKVERVSYPVMTPSAARGALEAVFWEPQMFYVVDSIRIVKRGRWISFRRNEVIKVISLDSAKTWMKKPHKTTPIQAGGGADDGTQRNMLALQDVEYLITAEIRLTTLANRPEDKIEKYLREFERRARSGKCFHRPALGVREFAGDFEWEHDPDAALVRRLDEERSRGSVVEPCNEDIGLILYDVFDHREREGGFRWLSDLEISRLQSQPGTRPGVRKAAADIPRWSRPPIKPQPTFFYARIERGRLDCHPERVHILTRNSGGE